MDPDRANPGDFDLEDPNLEEKLVNELKAQGIFDQFRKDCLSDVDTKVIMRMTFNINICKRVIRSHVKYDEIPINLKWSKTIFQLSACLSELASQS